MIGDILLGAACGLVVFAVGYVVGAVRWNRRWMSTLDDIREFNRDLERKAKDARNKRRRELRAARARERMDRAFEQSEADRREAEGRMP